MEEMLRYLGKARRSSRAYDTLAETHETLVQVRNHCMSTKPSYVEDQVTPLPSYRYDRIPPLLFGRKQRIVLCLN